MNFTELRSTIIISDRNDWRRILRSGPAYRDRFSPWESPSQGTSGIDIDSHDYVAVYDPDIDLTIAYGMRSPGSPSEPAFGWAEFPDPKVSICIADVFWRGALVDRVDYAVVDGGRCFLPLGEGHQGLRITHHDYSVARLLDSLEGGDRFDAYYSNVPYEYLD